MDGMQIPQTQTPPPIPGVGQVPDAGARRGGRTGPLTGMVECPLHAAMGQLAQAAVLQHVLHLEGEWLPRPELLLALEGWAGVHALIRAHVCPATREAPLEPAELSSFVDDALAPLFTPAEAPLRAQLRRTIARCAACGLAEGCPLDATLSEESAGHEGIG